MTIGPPNPDALEPTLTDMAADLTEALAKVQAAIPAIPKSQTARVETRSGGSYTYTYANLAKITPLVLPLLGANGLAWVTRPTMTPAGFVLEYELRHTEGGTISGTYPLPDPTRVTPQEIGSAITYARRYTLCSVVGVAPDDDDDDAAAAAKTRPTADKATRAPREARPRSAGTDAPATDAEPASRPSRPPQTEAQKAGARVHGMTPPELRDDAKLAKEDREARKATRGALRSLAGRSWGLHAEGLGGEALAAYGRMARQVARGEAVVEHLEGPPPAARLIDTKTGEALAEIRSDLPSDQGTDMTASQDGAQPQ